MSGRKQQSRETQKLNDLSRAPKLTYVSVMEVNRPQAGPTTSKGSLTDHEAGQTERTVNVRGWRRGRGRRREERKERGGEGSDRGRK